MMTWIRLRHDIDRNKIHYQIVILVNNQGIANPPVSRWLGKNLNRTIGKRSGLIPNACSCSATSVLCSATNCVPFLHDYLQQKNFYSQLTLSLSWLRVFPSSEDPASSNRDDMKYVIDGGMLIHWIFIHRYLCELCFFSVEISAMHSCVRLL